MMIDQLDTPVSSQLYWLVRNTRMGLTRWAARNKIKFVIGGCLLLLALFVFRGWVQPYVLALRINAFPILVGVGLLALSIWCFGKKRVWLGAILLLIDLAGVVGFVATKGQAREYLGLYWHYRHLEIVELDGLPLTDHERIQPLNSIRVLAGEGMTEVEHVGEPGFVRDGDGYYWTMSVEPSYAISRLMGKVGEVMKVSASAPSPNFSKENRAEVSFITGESLLLSDNARTAAIKRFGPVKFFNYAPSSVKYVRDDAGVWRQIVTLVRWKGIVFPRPVFGGVLVIDQSDGSLTERLTNILLGSGHWIPPREIASHPYLTGQSLVPAEVSRFTASSFRFQEGFFAPMPGYHVGDIRIPDVPGDFNDQPFTAYFAFDGEGDAKLFDYFALEPFQQDKQGLNTSVFLPADGIGPLRIYKHYDRGEALTGVSAIIPKIMESRKNYDWQRNSAAEQRPYIRDVGGKRRFFWLTTVVTYKDGDSRNYIAGSAPDVTLTDAQYKSVVWVDARNPGDWPEQLQRELGGVWQSN